MNQQRREEFISRMRIFLVTVISFLDEIPAEAIKADIEIAVKMLYSLFSKIWEKEEVPAQWKEIIIIKLPKKKETLGTAATIEGSCSCQRQARFSTGFYWRG